jgi:hypothetical protein
MDIEVRHILIAGVAGIILLLLNQQYQFLSAGLIQIMLVLGGRRIIKQNYGLGSSDPAQKTSISPNEAIPVIQDYLAESPGKRELWLEEDDYEATKIHDRVKKTVENGEKKKYYGIVARPYDPANQEADYTQMVREIWNLTDNEHHQYNGELPARLGAKTRLDPFDDVDDFIENQGTLEKQDNEDGRVTQNFNLQQSDRQRGEEHE